MKKLIVLGLVAGLVFGMLGPAEARKKKKKKPPVVTAPVVVDKTFFLRTDDCEALRLSIEDGDDLEGCGFFDGPIAQEIFGPILGYLPEIWTSENGVPVTLDTSGPVTGQVVTIGEQGVVGFGQSTVDITLTATIAGEPVTLGTDSSTNTVVPGDKKIIEFEFALIRPFKA